MALLAAEKQNVFAGLQQQRVDDQWPMRADGSMGVSRYENAMRDPRSKIEGDSAMVEVRGGDSCSNINSELSNY